MCHWACGRILFITDTLVSWLSWNRWHVVVLNSLILNWRNRNYDKSLNRNDQQLKTGLQQYYHTGFSISGVNQMLKLKNSKDLLETWNSRSHSTYAAELQNWFSVSSQRRTENKGIIILLLVETSLTLSKTIENLIININRTRSFQYKIFQSTTYLSCLVDGCFNKRLIFQWVRVVLRYSPICFYSLPSSVFPD